MSDAPQQPKSTPSSPSPAQRAAFPSCTIDARRSLKIDVPLVKPGDGATSTTQQPAESDLEQRRDRRHSLELEGAGNDRVTIDHPPSKPLIDPESVTNGPISPRSDELKRAPSRSVSFAAQIETQKTKVVVSESSCRTAPSQRPVEPPDPLEGDRSVDSERRVEVAVDPQEELMESIRRQRAPLTDLYHPFICPCDTSLEDARMRLETALEQTRRLRQAFTERVYGKYRVCLHPPPTLEEIIKPIRNDPFGEKHRLEEEIEQVRNEKELEKKEASQLNSELSKATTSSLNIDHAEQLMYLSAGLNLVILPEDTTIPSSQLNHYTDGRGPMQESGVRNRAISHAAATAGEVILDRTRKAAAMRVDRQRRNQLQLLSGDSTATATSSASVVTRLNAVLSQSDTSTDPQHTPVTGVPVLGQDSKPVGGISKKQEVPTFQPPASSSKPASTSTKQIRNRNSVLLSANSLLSLHPHSDQFDSNQRHTASTAALLARGVGHQTSTTKASTLWRLRHPHPESLGGKRRAGGGKDQKSGGDTHQLSQVLFQQTLPPLPTTRERLEKERLITSPESEAAQGRAAKAIKHVLDPFFPVGREESKLQTRIGMLHHLWKTNQSSNALEVDAGQTSATVLDDAANQGDRAIDPALTFMVLQAVGLVSRGGDTCNPPNAKRRRFEETPRLITTPSLDILQDTLKQSSPSIFDVIGRKSDVQHQETQDCPKSRTEEQRKASIVVESIRGGGESFTPGDGESYSNGFSMASIRGVGNSFESTGDAVDPSTNTLNPNFQDAAERHQTTDQHKTSEERNGIVWSNSSNQHMHRSIPQAIASDPMVDQNNAGYVALAQSASMTAGTLPGYLTPPERYRQTTSLNALHLAQQLQASNFHPQPGDISAGNLAFITTVPQRQDAYDLASFVQGSQGAAIATSHPSLAVFGLARQNQAVAEARAMFVREQQAAALMQSAQPGFQQTAQHFAPHVGGAHPAAVAALLGNSNQSHFIAQGQFGMAAVHQPIAAQFTQPIYQPHAQLQQASDSQNSVPQTIEQPVKPENFKSERREAPAPRPKRQRKTAPEVPEPIPLPPTMDQTTKAVDTVANEVQKSSAVFSSLAAPETSPQDSTTPPTQAPVELKPDPEPTSLGDTKVDQSPGRVQGERHKNVPDKHHPDLTVQHAGVAGKAQPSSTVETKDSISGGLNFFPPEIPSSLSASDSKLIVSARFHELVAKAKDESTLKTALAYLTTIGAAIPIPKTLVASPLKDRMNTPGFKGSGATSQSTIPRDIVTATILVWLWSHHEGVFQSAFAKSGRIDVDPDCKWLIQAAVDAAFRQLTNAVANDRATNSGPFAELASARKQISPKHATTLDSPAAARLSYLSSKVEVHTADVVSKALMTHFVIDVDSATFIPKFQTLMDYLDEARLAALQLKSQERSLLANLVARRTTMSEPFSQAYVSSMVRAGEAIGHGKLFEAVQMEDVEVTSLIPYDVFTDENNDWEDPCKPPRERLIDSNAPVLTRRAHARAIIQKSLHKLQERHGIHGGASFAGPYSEQNPESSEKGSSGQKSSGSRSGTKRKLSSNSEPPAPPGTGSAQAKTWAVYHPKHVSEPLEWNPGAIENLPYGKFSAFERPRTLSLSLAGRSSSDGKKGKKGKRSMSITVESQEEIVNPGEGFKRSTRDIPWADVADIFQRVELPKKSPSSRSSSSGHHSPVPLPVDGRIFAPFCRKVTSEIDATDESDGEEDLSDETVVARHEVVLEKMKSKLSAFLEVRRQQHDKRKGRQKNSA